MTLSDQTTETLRKALAELEAQQDNLRGELAQCTRAVESIRELLPKKGSVSLNGETFASRVREALMSIGRIAAPREVAQALIASGFKFQGKSDFGSVVANELFRQAQSKKSPIVKLGRGQYEAVFKKDGSSDEGS